jgi:hypothetical protein
MREAAALLHPYASPSHHTVLKNNNHQGSPHLHMMLAEPMSPVVPNLTASLVTLISTAGGGTRAGAHAHHTGSTITKSR